MTTATKLTDAEKAIIERAKTELATNFDVPAERIIGIACSKLGWQRADWNAYIKAQFTRG